MPATLTLAAIDTQRLAVEAKITEAIGAKIETVGDRVRYHERLHALYESLVTVFEAAERRAWVEATDVAGAMRWAITGARLRSDGARDAAIEWRAIEASTSGGAS